MDWGRANPCQQGHSIILLTGKGAKNFPKPDFIMYNSIIDTYSKNGKQHRDIQLFESKYTERKPYVISDDITYTCMIDMYAKAGNLLKAEELFESV
jgi:pentatricopeptide repeat protein